jgi:hypothetical protein
MTFLRATNPNEFTRRAIQPFALTVFLVVCLAVTAAMPASAKHLTINGLEIDLDDKSGSLLALSYPGLGAILKQDPTRAGLVVLDFAGVEFEPRSAPATVIQKDQTTTITWHFARPAAAKGDVETEVKILPAPDGKSVVLSCRVANRSERPVERVQFPDLRGLRPFGGKQAMELRFALGVVNPFAGPVRPAGRAPFYPPFVWRSFPAEPIYQMNTLRWLDLGTLAGGLSVFQRKWIEEPRPAILTRRSEADPDDLRVVWQHDQPIAPGASWESGEFWLTPHVGGWAKGIEPFRHYVSEVNPSRSLPRRIREGLGFQTVWMTAYSYREIPRIARDAKAHGIDELNLWVWCDYGNLPMKTRSNCGTEAELLDAIRQAHGEGVNVTLLVNLLSLKDELAPRYGMRPGNAANWNFDPGHVPGAKAAPLSGPSGQFNITYDNKLWREDVGRDFRRWAEAGAGSFCWDVFQDRNMDFIEAVRGFRAIIHASDPEATFAGEPTLGNIERATQVLDYTWNWIDYLEATPYINALGIPRLNCNIESDPRVVKMAFAENLYLNLMPKIPDDNNGTKLLSQEPELARALLEVAPLRRKFLAYFIDGVALGECILAKPACRYVRENLSGEIGGALFRAPKFEFPAVFVRSYQLGNKLLLIVLNNGDRPREVELTCNLSLWLPADRPYRVHHLDRTGEVIRTETLARDRSDAPQTIRTRSLKPLELGLLEVEQ